MYLGIIKRKFKKKLTIAKGDNLGQVKLWLLKNTTRKHSSVLIDTRTHEILFAIDYNYKEFKSYNKYELDKACMDTSISVDTLNQLLKEGDLRCIK